MRPELRPPSGGTQPPATACLPGGETLHLSPLAHEISRRFLAEHPDELERYGEAAFDWCAHDNQWILSWASHASPANDFLDPQIRWLADLLEARGYPRARLVRDLEIAADVVREDSLDARAIADRLAEASRTLSTAAP